MKNSSEYAPRLKKLCNKVKGEIVAIDKTDLIDPTIGLVLACLSAVTTEKKAIAGLNKLRHNFVDFNELRVSRPEELMGLLGGGFPQAKETSYLIINLLKQVFDKLDSMDLNILREWSKREAKSFLNDLEASTTYIVSRVMLLSIDAHTFPIHKQMLDMLRKEEVVDPDADESEVQGFLEHQISAKQMQKTYFLLRRYADTYKPKRAKTKKTVEKKTAKSSGENSE